MSKDTVQNGLVVSMEYTLTVDGEVLDSSEGAGPLQFLAGHDNIVPGLEQKMIGMKIGESKDVVVSPEDGYGEFDDEAFMEVPRSEFPADMELEEGLEFTSNINADSLEILGDCRMETSLESAKAGDYFQFERIGYFNVDPDSTEKKLVFNRSVSLKDSWGRKRSGTNE